MSSASAPRKPRPSPGSHELTEAFAKGLFKLMAYKDEYEVARLYSDGEFAKALQEQFDGDRERQGAAARRRCWRGATR